MEEWVKQKLEKEKAKANEKSNKKEGPNNQDTEEPTSDSEYPSPAEVAAQLKAADPAQGQSTVPTEPAEAEESKDGVRATTQRKR